MKKILFLVLYLFNLSVFAEYQKTLILTSEVTINDKLHSLLFYEFKPTFIKLELILNNDLIGYVKFKGNTNTEIDSLYIKEDFRNQKYASFLMKYLCDYLFAKDVKVISLYPVPFEEIDGEMIFDWQDDEKTLLLIKFYEKLGFVKQDKYRMALCNI